MRGEIQVLPAPAEAARAAAALFSQQAKSAVAARGRFRVALSGGRTPEALFGLLADPQSGADAPWSCAHVFWGDERAVPPDHLESNYRQAGKLLLDWVAVPDGRVHRIRGELGSAAAAADYASVLQQHAAAPRNWPRFDIAIMGMGTDGHTASLFPAPISRAERNQAVIGVVVDDYEGRPTERISLTPQVFNDARLLLFLVTGRAKAQTLRAVLEGPLRPAELPAQRIRPTDGALHWIVDAEAASLLRGHSITTQP